MYLLPEEMFAEAMSGYSRHGLTQSRAVVEDAPLQLAKEGGGDDGDACIHEPEEHARDESVFNRLEDASAELGDVPKALRAQGAGGSWRATWLAEVFRAEGLSVVEVEGWRTRGIAFPDSPAEEGVSLFHHTASSAKSGPAGGLRVVTYGREGLAGPICNWLTARNGVIYVVASGVANHAGRGNARAAGLPNTTGNTNCFGNEMENDGVGEKFSAVQYTAAIKSHAAVHRKMGWGASRGIGHKEWSTSGKPDPKLDMAQVRRDLATAIARVSPGKKTPTAGEDLEEMDQKAFNSMFAAALRDATVMRLIGDAVKATEYNIDAKTKKGTRLGVGLTEIDDKLDKILKVVSPPKTGSR